MGRAEGFAQSNPPLPSFFDGLASGIGYTIILLIISFIREILGFGSIFGISLIPESVTRWTLMVMPPSAFFILACIMWLFNNNRLKKQREGVEKK
jgi:Na+-transporting NADH:ubiquinone oxidoreductase subunit D